MKDLFKIDESGDVVDMQGRPTFGILYTVEDVIALVREYQGVDSYDSSAATAEEIEVAEDAINAASRKIPDMIFEMLWDHIGYYVGEGVKERDQAFAKEAEAKEKPDGGSV